MPCTRASRISSPGSAIRTREAGITAEANEFVLHGQVAIAVAIFIATYLVIAIGKLPPFLIDRAGAALLGASLMVAFGVLSLDEAFAAVDYQTLVLLLGMMIVVANLRLSGVFQWVNAAALRRARHPLLLLAAIVLLTGLFSAFLVNDAICLVMTPLVIDLTRALERNPVPYLLAVAMASNAGSVATITGNPQNMMIGSFSHIPYGAFSAALAPIAVVALLLTFALVVVFNGRAYLTRKRLETPAPRIFLHRWLAAKTVAVTLAMIALFFLGQPVAKVAIVAGAVLLLTRGVKAHKVYAQIDWPLLVMFAGLFIVVAGLQKSVLTPDILAWAEHLRLSDPAVLSVVTAALSNVVSNVPAVLVLKPFIEQLGDPQKAWLVVAMASTLAGNFTLVGSVANLIVAQGAANRGIEIGFWRYFAIGAPLTFLTILFGVWWLS